MRPAVAVLVDNERGTAEYSPMYREVTVRRYRDRLTYTTTVSGKREAREIAAHMLKEKEN